MKGLEVLSHCSRPNRIHETQNHTKWKKIKILYTPKTTTKHHNQTPQPAKHVHEMKGKQLIWSAQLWPSGKMLS